MAAVIHSAGELDIPSIAWLLGLPDEKSINMGIQGLASIPQKFEYSPDKRLGSVRLLYDISVLWKKAWMVFDPITRSQGNFEVPPPAYIKSAWDGTLEVPDPRYAHFQVAPFRQLLRLTMARLTLSFILPSKAVTPSEKANAKAKERLRWRVDMQRLMTLADWLGSWELQVLAKRGLLRSHDEGLSLDISYQSMEVSSVNSITFEDERLKFFTSYWSDVFAIQFHLQNRRVDLTTSEKAEAALDFIQFGLYSEGERTDWMSEATKGWILCLKVFVYMFIELETTTVAKSAVQEAEGKLGTPLGRVEVTLNCLSALITPSVTWIKEHANYATMLPKCVDGLIRLYAILYPHIRFVESGRAKDDVTIETLPFIEAILPYLNNASNNFWDDAHGSTHAVRIFRRTIKIPQSHSLWASHDVIRSVCRIIRELSWRPEHRTFGSWDLGWSHLAHCMNTHPDAVAAALRNEPSVNTRADTRWLYILESYVRLGSSVDHQSLPPLDLPLLPSQVYKGLVKVTLLRYTEDYSETDTVHYMPEIDYLQRPPPGLTLSSFASLLPLLLNLCLLNNYFRAEGWKTLLAGLLEKEESDAALWAIEDFEQFQLVRSSLGKLADLILPPPESPTTTIQDT